MITDYGVKGMLGAALSSFTPLSNMLSSICYMFGSELAAGQAEKLDFIGNIPAMSRWLGKRQDAIPIAHAYQVVMEKFETSAVLPLDWLENDKTALVQQRIGQIPVRRNQLYGKLAADLINAAATAVAYDGVAYFSSSHSHGGHTIDNAIDVDVGTPAAPTPLEMANAIYRLYQTMLSFVDDRGEPCNEDISAMKITCGTSLAASAMQAIDNNTLDTGAGTVDNPLRGLRAAGVQLQLCASPRLTSTTKIQAWKANPGSAPLAIGRNGKSAKMTAKAGGSDFEHDEDAHAYGYKETVCAGYGLFTDACEATFI